MSSEQQLAFQLGSGANATTLLIAIAAIVLTLALVWSMWVTFGAFRAWQDGAATLFDIAWSAIRVSIILMVLGYYLR
jgi:integrating conjugative element protein (TIGR03758 family)